MERVLSQDERIKRAEELYARRRMQSDNRRSATVNVEDYNSNKTTKKLIKQFIICLILYIVIYTLKNSPDIFSKNVMYKISDILEYDINIQAMYNDISSYLNKNQEEILQNGALENVADTTNVIDTQNTVDEQNPQLVEETLSVTETIPSNTETITENEGHNTNEQTDVPTEESSSMSQMEIDAEYIKANYIIMKPLEGEITSRFGIRNPTVPTVPKYHTGIDIARVTGTIILAAMEGTVELVSSEGDYGNHVKITNGEVSTLYAHCNKIYVKEGDKIVQGQQIAEVGATGNVTGPHLHFEIRRNNQYVDPDLILDF